MKLPLNSIRGKKEERRVARGKRLPALRFSVYLGKMEECKGVDGWASL